MGFIWDILLHYTISMLQLPNIHIISSQYYRKNINKFVLRLSCKLLLVQQQVNYPITLWKDQSVSFPSDKKYLFSIIKLKPEMFLMVNCHGIVVSSKAF